MIKRFWLFLDMELINLLPRFEKVFQVDNLERDYENVWEWIESCNDESEFNIDISRSHNWDTGNYKEPIDVFVKKNSGEPIDVDEIGNKLLEEFKTTVFYGELAISTKDLENYTTKVEKVFEMV